MMQTTAAHHHTDGDPNQPCGRHARAGEGVVSSSQPSNKNRRGLYLTFSSPSIKKTAGIAALFLSAAITHPASAAAVTGSQPSYAVMASEASRQHIFDGTAVSSVLASLWGGINHNKSTMNNRFLQVEEDDHDHADEIHANETDLHDLHADEHHDEPGHADEHVEDIHHEEHDHDELHHADEAAAMQLDEVDHHDEHDDHGDHGDEHDEHDDHGDHDHGHGDLDEHAHGAESSTMYNENVTGKSGEPWGAVIGATLLVNVATFSGVLILVLPAMYRGVLKYRGIPAGTSAAANGNGRFFDIVIPGFAVGALVATAVFLVLPEAVNYLSGGAHAGHEGEGEGGDHDGHGHRFLQEDSHAGEGSAAAKFGCSVLGGFLLPFVFAIIFHHTDPNANEGAQEPKASVAVDNEEAECESCNGSSDDADVKTGADENVATGNADVETGVDVTVRTVEPLDETNDEGAVEAVVTKSFVNKRLCAAILLGDSFHNFADGFFIAAAFRACSVGVAISIMLVTLFHEIAQELADFIVLTKYGGLTVGRALFYNFLSGLSVCLGGVVFLAANPTDTATGVILAMAGGVYINIAACETAPRMEGAIKGRWDRVLMLFSIILGTIPLGLILLDHKHCG